MDKQTQQIIALMCWIVMAMALLVIAVNPIKQPLTKRAPSAGPTDRPCFNCTELLSFDLPTQPSSPKVWL